MKTKNNFAEMIIFVLLSLEELVMLRLHGEILNCIICFHMAFDSIMVYGVSALSYGFSEAVFRCHICLFCVLCAVNL